MRTLYPSQKGGKPLRFGMNRAKRIAKSADNRDQLAVQRELGTGLPRQHSNHQALVKQRHQYYADLHEEMARDKERLRLEAQIAAGAGADAADAGDADRAISEPAPGATDQ